MEAEQYNGASIASRVKRGLSTPVVVASCGALIAVVMIGLCGLVLYQSRQDALDRTRDTLRDVAVIAQRDIERNLELYELSLQAVVDGLQQGDDVMALPPHLRREVLFDRAASAKYLGSMLVLDERGNILIDSSNDTPRAGNFSDRPYFIVQRDHSNAGLYISDPFQSRLRNRRHSDCLCSWIRAQWIGNSQRLLLAGGAANYVLRMALINRVCVKTH